MILQDFIYKSALLNYFGFRILKQKNIGPRQCIREEGERSGGVSGESQGDGYNNSFRKDIIFHINST